MSFSEIIIAILLLPYIIALEIVNLFDNLDEKLFLQFN